MSNPLQDRFEDVLNSFGIDTRLSAQQALQCIEFARQAMKEGSCSVEAFYRAKDLILSCVEPDSYLEN